MYELFIEGQRADINDKISIQLTYAIDDIRNFASRETSFSKQIVLPGTGKITLSKYADNPSALVLPKTEQQKIKTPEFKEAFKDYCLAVVASGVTLGVSFLLDFAINRNPKKVPVFLC